MNKLKYLLLLVLCVGLVGAVSHITAQTSDKVLVSAGGKTLRQADIDKMIQFYEWAFEAKFSADERARFGEFTAREFRSDPANARATIDDIVGTLPKILAAAADVQQETRKNFLAAFLPEARQNADENSQMLVGIYDAAHGGNDSNSAANGENNPAQNDDSYETVKKVGVGNLSAIVGKWVSGSSGSMTKTTSGVYLGGNASRHTYQFNADGTVEYTGIMNMMTGGCRMQIFKSAKGRASLSGSTLTINWSPASFSRDDSCSPSKNYKKTLPAEVETMQVNFETYYDDKQLCLTTTDKTCFSRD